jgi:hypothetical protein
MRFLILALFLLLSLPATAADTLQFPANGKFILPITAGEAAFRQCSRGAPQATEFWLPTDKDIAALEADLPAFIAKQNPGYPPSHSYHRQYMGFMKDGKKFIYGNFYASSDTSPTEATMPVVVCDGGPAFWGVVYEPATKSFSDISFNGHV